MEEARGGYPFIPSRLNCFLCDKEELAANEPDDSAPVAGALQDPPDRDEGAALEEAARDLIRLDRYERRAWSQQRRAILASMNMKLMKGIAATNGGSAYVAEEAPAAGEVKHLCRTLIPSRKGASRGGSRVAAPRSSRHVAVPPQEITRARAVKASAGGGRRDCS
jgi:hypothetical protein